VRFARNPVSGYPSGDGSPSPRQRLYGLRFLLAGLLAAPTVTLASPRSVVSAITHRPEQAGQCFSTRVKQVTTRLAESDGRPVPGSGSAVVFADGHLNVEYQAVAAMDRSRPGDRVRLCVRNLPSPSCPKGDNRGIVYRAHNLRTGLTWVSSDAEHGCGGA
jgi:hypothetical protein